MLATATETRRRTAEEDLDHEIRAIARALEEGGVTDRSTLARLVGARFWGPGRFAEALREAVAEGDVRHVSGRNYGPVERSRRAGGGGDGSEPAEQDDPGAPR